MAEESYIVYSAAFLTLPGSIGYVCTRLWFTGTDYRVLRIL